MRKFCGTLDELHEAIDKAITGLIRYQYIASSIYIQVSNPSIFLTILNYSFDNLTQSFEKYTIYFQKICLIYLKLIFFYTF